MRIFSFAEVLGIGGIGSTTVVRWPGRSIIAACEGLYEKGLIRTRHSRSKNAMLSNPYFEKAFIIEYPSAPWQAGEYESDSESALWSILADYGSGFLTL